MAAKISEFLKRNRLVPLLVPWLGVVATWAFVYIVLKDDPDRGTLGDLFGGANALFAGLAFATLIYTAWLQRTELDETRRVMRDQAVTMEIQRFEGTFFALLNSYRERIASLESAPRNGETPVGYRALVHLYQDLAEACGNARNGDMAAQAIIEKTSAAFFGGHGLILKPALRHLQELAAYAMRAPDGTSAQYVRLIKAQLTDYELTYLFFYSKWSESDLELYKVVLQTTLLGRLNSRLVPAADALTLHVLAASNGQEVGKH